MITAVVSALVIFSHAVRHRPLVRLTFWLATNIGTASNDSNSDSKLLSLAVQCSYSLSLRAVVAAQLYSITCLSNQAITRCTDRCQPGHQHHIDVSRKQQRAEILLLTL
jgi:hypothetical protein